MKALIYYGNKDIKLENHWNDPYLDDEFNAIIKINFTSILLNYNGLLCVETDQSKF